jgi:hypothetical protein
MSKTIKFGTLFMAALCASAAQAATLTYNYTGNEFTVAVSPQTTTNFVSGSFTLPAALGDNLFNEAITPSTYSFSDGLQTMTNANSAIEFFDISTGGSGQITGWYIYLYTVGELDNDIIYTSSIYGGGIVCGVCDFVSNVNSGESGEVINDPGTWTPEPSTVALMSLGILAGAFVARKRLVHPEVR